MNAKLESEVCFVLDTLKSRIETYPSPLREQGLRYLNKLSLLTESKERTCEAYILIPFWLKDSFGLDPLMCRTISLATIFSVLYFMTQDEVMDSHDYKGNILPLSSTFYYEFISRYYSIFNTESMYWDYFETYMDEWAQSVLWERTHHWKKINSYSDDDFILLARKTSGIKLPFAAACILAEKEHYIQNFSDMVDHDQVVYQLYDDWRDRYKDIEKENYTYILVEAMKYLGLNNLKNVSRATLEKAFSDEKFIKKYFQVSHKYNQMSANAVECLGIPYISKYIEIEAKICILEPLREFFILKNGFTGDLGRFIYESV